MTDTAKPELSNEHALFKLATELAPLGIFFFVNARWDLFAATAAFMAATAVSLTLSKIVLKKMPVMPFVSGIFVFVFGGLTLYLQDEIFIKMKPTIVNLLFAAILIGGLLYGKLLLKIVFGEVMRLKDEGWRLLSWRWAAFFLFLAALNEFIWRTFSTDFWVSFKVFGIMPLTLIFTVSQIGLLQRYQIDDAATAPQGPSA